METNNTVKHRDFPALEAALEYADDVASEDDDPPPTALVLDSGFAVVCSISAVP